MTVRKRMDVIFKDEEEYQKFKSGKVHSNKGLRTEGGRLSSYPDIEEIDEDTEEEFVESDPVEPESGELCQRDLGIGETVLLAILEGLYEGVREFLSDEQNREAVKAIVQNWWYNKAAPGIRSKWNDVKYIVHGMRTGETKAERILKRTSSAEIVPVEKIELAEVPPQEDRRIKITPEQYQEQVAQIQVLAVLLADRIQKLSNSCIDPEAMTEEEYELQQKDIKELTADEVMNSVRLLIEHNDFSLDDKTNMMFTEFLAGNLIVDGRKIPIETVKDARKRMTE